MAENLICDQCGAEIPLDAPEGVCVQCLARVAFSFAKPAVKPPLAPESALERIRYFGDYELLEEIARGGMGVVYRARQVSLNRIVAVKMLLFGKFSSDEFVKRFQTEAQAAASLHHPNIVVIHEIGEHEGQRYFSMDYVPGKSLGELVRESPMPATRAAGYLKTIAEAVHYAHRHGILHRDLKPSNVLIDELDQPRITDFGLAKQLKGDSGLTLPGQVLGSPNYMPPEQASPQRGTVGTPSDVYSLGAVLYQLLTGRPPFLAETVEDTLHHLLNNEPVGPRQLNASVPRDLETICLKCLDKDPGGRYASAQALADELGRFLRDEPIQARPIGSTARLWRWCRRNRPLARAAATAMALLLVLAIGSPIAAFRINRERMRAQKNAKFADEQRREAETALYQARLNENHALRLARPQGWSELAYCNLSSNATMSLPQRDQVELRREAAVCMEEIDVRKVGELVGHKMDVWSLDFSPDSALLASADYGGISRVWQVATKEMLSEIKDPAAGSVQRYGQSAPFPTIRFNPRGGEMALSTWRHSIEVLGLMNQAEVVLRLSSSVHAKQLDYDRFGRVIAVAWAGDRVVAYDASSGSVIREIQTYGTTVAVSPDGSAMVTIGAENAIQLQSLTSADPPLVLGQHQKATRVTFSPRGNLLASASQDHTAKIFDVKAAKELFTLLGHKARVHTAVFRNDGRLVVTVSDDHTARLWDTHTGQTVLIIRPETGNPVLAAAFSPDGRYLALASGKIILYELTNEPAKRLLFGHGYHVRSLAFHPNRPLLASASGDNSLRLWNLDSGEAEKVLLQVQAGGQPHGLAFSADGTLLAVGHSGYSNYGPSDHGLRLLEVASGEFRRPLGGHHHNIPCAAFDPAGLLLASGDVGGVVTVHVVATGQELQRWSQEGDRVVAVRFITPGYRLLMMHTSGQLRVGDCLSGEIVAQTKTANNPTSFAVAPAQNRVAVACDYTTIQFFSLPDLALIATNQARIAGACALAFSSDGRLLASAGEERQAILWDGTTGAKVLELPPQESPIFCLAFEPNGSRLAISGVEEQITVWHIGLVRERLRGLGIDWVESDLRRRQPPEDPLWPQTLVESFLNGAHPLATNALSLARCATLLARQTTHDPELLAKAETAGLKAVELAPKELEVWMQRIELLQERGDEVGAMAWVDRAITQNHEDPLFWSAKGMILKKSGRFEQACQAFARAIRLTSANGSKKALNEALLQRASLLRELGHHAEAALDFCHAWDIPPRDPRTAPNLVDLTVHYNGSLTEGWIPSTPFGTTVERNLGELPRGIQQFDGVQFDVRGLVQMAGRTLNDFLGASYPKTVKDINANQKCSRLHFLQGTGWRVPDGTVIGRYVIRYEDGEQEEAPIIYGDNVRDWWFDPNAEEPTAHAVPAWTGKDAAVEKAKQMLRLYKFTWENPRADSAIKSIDFESLNSNSSPFLIAITAEP